MGYRYEILKSGLHFAAADDLEVVENMIREWAEEVDAEIVDLEYDHAEDGLDAAVLVCGVLILFYTHRQG